MAAGKPAARVQVRGAAEFRKAMKGMGADLKDLTAANKEAAELVARDARQRVPIRSGKLVGSIRTKATKTRAEVLAGSNTIPYAGVIHFGWPAHGIAPQPFLYDAADDRTDDVVNLYNERIEAMVRKVERTTPP
jgi:hypothetical protein